MTVDPLASCEIVPQLWILIEGDVHFGGLMPAIVVTVWFIIRKKR